MCNFAQIFGKYAIAAASQKNKKLIKRKYYDKNEKVFTHDHRHDGSIAVCKHAAGTDSLER